MPPPEPPYELYHGDCRDELGKLDDNSIDAPIAQPQMESCSRELKLSRDGNV